jgi:hypothetical protein
MPIITISTIAPQYHLLRKVLIKYDNQQSSTKRQTFSTGKIQYLTPREKFEHKQTEDRTVKLNACTIINEYQTNQNYVYINYEVKNTHFFTSGIPTKNVTTILYCKPPT